MTLRIESNSYREINVMSAQLEIFTGQKHTGNGGISIVLKLPLLFGNQPFAA